MDNCGGGAESPCRCGDIPLLRKGAGVFRRFCAIFGVISFALFRKRGCPSQRAGDSAPSPHYINDIRSKNFRVH